MELIASSRIVKAQSRVEASRPYAEQLTKAMEDVASRSASIDHPLLENRGSATKIGVLVITSDRGLAGAYNANVLKIAEQHLREIRGRGMEPVLYVIGKKGVGYFRFRGVPMQASWQGFSEVPPYEKAEVVGRQLIQDFADETIDELHCTYTDFRSAFTLRATSKRFLPIAPEEVTGAAREAVPAEYLFEPEPTEKKSFLPSGEKAMSRVQWCCHGMRWTIFSGAPLACRSPFLYAKRTAPSLFAT